MPETNPDYGKCALRADKTCVGPDKCLRHSDAWLQERVMVKLMLSNADGASSSLSSKATHDYFVAIRLSEGTGKNREKFLDNMINARKKCALEKLLDAKGLTEQLPDETDADGLKHTE
jgi:hypothetical protein